VPKLSPVKNKLIVNLYIVRVKFSSVMMALYELKFVGESVVQNNKIYIQISCP